MRPWPEPGWHGLGLPGSGRPNGVGLALISDFVDDGRSGRTKRGLLDFRRRRIGTECMRSARSSRSQTLFGLPVFY